MYDLETEARRSVPADLADALKRAWAEAFSGAPHIVAVYLYGSAARGGPARDIDIAVARPGAVMLSLREHALLVRELESRSPVDLPVDLRELDEEDAVFSFHVLETGIRIYERQHDERVAFEAAVLVAYQDVMPMVSQARRAVVQRR
jgi:predicted nucleotidyltransferase